MEEALDDVELMETDDRTVGECGYGRAVTLKVVETSDEAKQ